MRTHGFSTRECSYTESASTELNTSSMSDGSSQEHFDTDFFDLFDPELLAPAIAELDAGQAGGNGQDLTVVLF
eukprot:CAMPEP_0198735552 /NCGR_PEP_ID=MMETSP1475-20131203/60389_1 /TAXON_ID= ORGANISM="Unidentified sp., Strain CCMP1999" /NCGR_SAMPLE_ID=MMETSP1475 /ASSEMBLY_ACC=CAM_ASM_001111 /LENGTH=72 /DNA_ID=CAMNT_0044499229 /DNA_START=196 /DNA_END=414 /DNA_ORIENTATION=+